MKEWVKPLILVIEDDFVDLEMVKRGIKTRSIDADVINALDGNAALGLLRSGKIDRRRQSKMIILLDVNMPGMNGHQFLDELRGNEQLRRLVVFMLTTSDHQRDILRAYDRNVAGYFLKSQLDGLLDTVAKYLQSSLFPPVAALTTA